MRKYFDDIETAVSSSPDNIPNIELVSLPSRILLILLVLINSVYTSISRLGLRNFSASAITSDLYFPISFIVNRNCLFKLLLSILSPSIRTNFLGE